MELAVRRHTLPPSLKIIGASNRVTAGEWTHSHVAQHPHHCIFSLLKLSRAPQHQRNCHSSMILQPQQQRVRPGHARPCPGSASSPSSRSCCPHGPRISSSQSPRLRAAAALIDGAAFGQLVVDCTLPVLKVGALCSVGAVCAHHVRALLSVCGGAVNVDHLPSAAQLPPYSALRLALRDATLRLLPLHHRGDPNPTPPLRTPTGHAGRAGPPRAEQAGNQRVHARAHARKAGRAHRPVTRAAPLVHRRQRDPLVRARVFAPVRVRPCVCGCVRVRMAVSLAPVWSLSEACTRHSFHTRHTHTHDTHTHTRHTRAATSWAWAWG
jgi:hypothetical protein